MWCAADNYNDTCHTCAEGFLDSSFSLAIINKLSNFHEIAPNFRAYIFTKIVYFLSIFGD